MIKQGKLGAFLASTVVGAALSIVPAKAWAVDVNIDAVGEGGGCMMVHFTNTQGGVNYAGIATSTTNAAQNSQAERFMSLATAALLSGKKFRVVLTSANCGTNTNVRVVSLFEVHP